MSFFLDEQKLTAHFKDAWDNVANPYRTIPVEFPLEKKEPDQNGEIIRFRVKKAMTGGFALGENARHYGSVIVQFVTKSGSGPGRALEVADAVREIFAPGWKPIRLGALRCRRPSPDGPFEEGTLATMNVDIPWWSDYSA